MSKLRFQSRVFGTKLKTDLRIKLRLRILKLASKVPSAHPHIGSCMSCIDILIQTLIFEMRPQDKFILSKGHASLALYVVLNYLGKISDRKLEETYFSEGTDFGIHTPSSFPKDIPLATGSLGHGLSFAAGLAKGYKLQKKPHRVFCLMSDGECNEGAVWEAAQFASQHKLDNLYAMIDKNRLQAFGRTEDVLGDAASQAKWKAFGFNVVEVDGHNLTDIEMKFMGIKKLRNKKPNILICNTVRGKGIKAIENKVVSNYTAMVGQSYEKALKDVGNL
ncbi:transketolase [Candidatus Roizmanbacteria bacterium]|nr:transketolase [Candidatus Roizmanbacteria bacterium]